MNEDMDEFIIDGLSKKSSHAKAIADVMKEKDSLIEKQQTRIHDWFVTKGWVYLMVFIMGILVGGLIWK